MVWMCLAGHVALWVLGILALGLAIAEADSLEAGGPVLVQTFGYLSLMFIGSALLDTIVMGGC